MNLNDYNDRYAYWEEILEEPNLKRRQAGNGYKNIIPKIPPGEHTYPGYLNKALNWLKGLKQLEKDRMDKVIAANKPPMKELTQEEKDKLRKKYYQEH